MRSAPASLALTLAALLPFSSPAEAGGRRSPRPPPKRGEWLVRHQDLDGSWDPVRFAHRCEESGPCTGPGRDGDRVGTTGLALLCFLGYGETHRTPKYGSFVNKALLWFRGAQVGKGGFEKPGGDRFLLNHARATAALAELHGLTGSPLVRGTAQRAVDLLLSGRLEEGGWPSSQGGTETDLETSTWAVLALRSAAAGGLVVGEDGWGNYPAWLDAGTDGETGRFGPEPKPASEGHPGPETATAMAILSRRLMGVRKDDPLLAKGVALLLRRLPESEADGGAQDFLYLYFGSQACRHAGRGPWRKWSAALKEAVIDTQCMASEPCSYGSWDPSDVSKGEGRIGCTALGILTLETYYRYARCFCGGGSHGQGAPERTGKGR